MSFAFLSFSVCRVAVKNAFFVIVPVRNIFQGKTSEPDENFSPLNTPLYFCSYIFIPP